MYITIPARGEITSTEIFVKILKKSSADNFSWDRNVIVLIHGGPGGNHTLYADIEDSLYEIADLVLIDLRGCGLSQKTETRFCTLDTHVDDLLYLLKALYLSSPIIHGCSYGAIVALGFNIKYPGVTQKLILTSCAASGSFIEDAKNNLKLIGTPQQIEFAEKLWNGAFENQEQFIEYYRLLSPLYFFKRASVKALPASSMNIPYNIDLINFAFTTFLRRFDFCSELPKIITETLIFSGKNDWIFDNKQAVVLHHNIKNSVLISLNECGHFPWKDQRDKFLSQIKLFIEDKINIKQQRQFTCSI